MSEQHNKASPAEGIVIPRSTVKLVAGIAVLFFALALFIGTIWAWWSETAVLGFWHVNGSQAVGAMLGAAIAGLLMPLLVGFLFVGERLIVAADRLQLVRSFRGDTVDLQIPYANVEEFFLGKDDGVPFLGIRLRDPADPDTFAASWDFAA